jgi:UDP-N-acetylmuramoylalanine--D-glutamate ligase
MEAVARGIPVIAEIEAAYRMAAAPILAVTGTNGKTTTTLLLAEMLRAAGFETYAGGNVAAGDIGIPLSRAAMLAPASSAIVAEISSFQLEWISSFRPRVAAILNITPDHGDRQTWDEYVYAKWRIFENQTAEDYAILHEDPIPGERRKNLKSQVCVFGRMNSNRHTARALDGALCIRCVAHSNPEASWQQICCVDELRLPGLHNVDNVLAAAAMASAFGAPPEAIRKAAIGFAGVVHRLEYVDTVGGVRYINNSMCTNVAAIERSLEALPEPKVLVMGGVFKGSPDDLDAMASAVAASNVCKLILIGRDAAVIDAALRKRGCEGIERTSTMDEAVDCAHRSAVAGQTVMLAPGCASFDMFRDFEDRGEQFKRAVRKLKGDQDSEHTRIQP